MSVQELHELSKIKLPIIIIEFKGGNNLIIFKERGINLRSEAKNIVLEFMNSSNECKPQGQGKKQAEIFRDCGLDWGDQGNSASSQQQFWIVALLRVLESDGKVQRDPITKRWRLL